MAELQKLREQIDQIDGQLVDLLNRRADLALEVKKTKEKDKLSVYAPDRERKILDRVLALSQGGTFPKAPLERIFINIISATRSLVGGLTVSYLGPEYSHEHEAALKQFGEVVHYLPEAGIEDVLAKVERGDALYGVIPARTGSLGLVAKTFDLLLQSPLVIIAEVEIREQLALYSQCQSLSEVLRIYASAYSYGLCDAWLTASLPSVERMLQNHLIAALQRLKADQSAALIASTAVGERFGLNALANSIQSEVDQGSRFIVVGTKATSPTGNDKTSLVCAVKDRAGALRDILRPFAERGITLLKIESHPIRNHAWEYAFFIDFVGHVAEPAVAETIKELTRMSSFLKTLGSYPLLCQS